MRSLVIIQRDTFTDRGWLSCSGYSFCRNQTVLPLVAAELTKAAAAMPIAFVRDENAGQFQLVGLCSLDEGRNLFVAPDGQWLSSYVPAALRGYPFALMRVEASAQMLLAIDEASGLVVSNAEPGAKPFFDPDGRPAGPVQQILEFLSQIDANLQATNRALVRLEEAGVIVPWAITLDTPEGHKAVNGLFRVDIDRLRALDDDVFLKLRIDDAIFIALLQLSSVEHLSVFSSLANLQIKMEENNKIKTETIQKSFISTENDNLKFDWSNL